MTWSGLTISTSCGADLGLRREPGDRPFQRVGEFGADINESLIVELYSR